MAAVNQMAMDVLVNQRVTPLSNLHGGRSIRPNGRKYNSYTPEMRTRIAKYAMMAGDLEAAHHFTHELGHKVAVTSVWRFRKAYTRELKHLHQEGTGRVPTSSIFADKRRLGNKNKLRRRGLGTEVASDSEGIMCNSKNIL